ncbi:MAG: cyclic pyranopterin monophosphate synthase MoaC [Gemmatimonadota bacterium]|nr:cyclic pyranopterin monophosphate synthase MoaC [Gemmatimonadota bacterium]
MLDDPLPHLDGAGRARMVDVSDKPPTRRTAVAEGTLSLRPATLRAIRERHVGKGDVEAVTRIAAIGGAKRAADLVPLCHPLPLDGVRVEIEAAEPGTESAAASLRLRVEVTTVARTGVEMEALCGVAAGLLAAYDMCKSLDREMEIGPVRLLEKRGGRSGTWRRPGHTPVAPDAGKFDSGAETEDPKEGMA